MPRQIDISQFELRIDDVVAVAPCLRMALYVFDTNNDGILDFYQRSMEALGGLLTHYQAENMRDRARINKRALTMLPTWVKRPRYDRNYYLEFYGCDYDHGVTPANLAFHLMFKEPKMFTPEMEKIRIENAKKIATRGWKIGPWASMLIVTLPLDHPLAAPDRYLAWVKDFNLLKKWSFHSGACGYGFNYLGETGEGRIRGPMTRWLGSHCLRHPGFECEINSVIRKLWRYAPDIHPLSLPLIKRVNWLSMVSDISLKALGGRKGVRSALGDDPAIEVHDLEHGALIRAGEAPQAGDVGRGDFIPAYRRVAKVLRPVRYDGGFAGLGRGFSEDAATQWLDAFDEPYD